MQAEVRIERYADQGRCVAHIDGRVVFVRFALPDELVRVELDEPHDRDDRFWTGEVVEVLEPSEDRITPAWPLAGPLAMGGGVGGADLVHVSLPGQLKWKAITVSEQMSRLGHIDVAVPIERMPGDKAAGGLNWRTRIEMIADDNGMPSMRRRGTHNRVAIDTMPLATRTLLDVAKREHVWEGGFEPGSQIRLSVPEPRGEIVDTAAADDNYAVLVDGELRAGSQLLTEQVTINGTTFDYQPGDCVFVPGIRAAIENGAEDIPAQVICRDGSTHDLLLHVRGLTQDEKEIILDGCLMNYYAARM